MLRTKNTKLKLKVIQQWCRDILAGLKYLHEQTPPIIHRDIKCDNIFINTNNSSIKIGDLGLATVLHKGVAASFVGTPEYMALELYTGKYDTKVDVYAFGMCLLEMITLETPYKECENQGIIYQRVTTGKPPEALERVSDPNAKAIIKLCLNPAETRPTVAELLTLP